MKSGQKGFSLIELLVAMSITVLIAAAVQVTLSQVYGGTEKNNNNITVARQAEGVGIWMLKDVQRALTVTTDNLTSPEILQLTWTTWDADGNPTYSVVNYYFDNVTDGVGTLKRNYLNSAGVNSETLVGIDLYYDPDDAANTTMASFNASTLTVRVTAIVEQARETREFQIKIRPNIF